MLGEMTQDLALSYALKLPSVARLIHQLLIGLGYLKCLLAIEMRNMEVVGLSK